MKPSSRHSSTSDVQNLLRNKGLTSMDNRYCSTENKLLTGSAASRTSGNALVTLSPASQHFQGRVSLPQKPPQSNFNTSIQKNKLRNCFLEEFSAKKFKSDLNLTTNTNIPISTQYEPQESAKKREFKTISSICKSSADSFDSDDVPAAKHVKFKTISNTLSLESVVEQDDEACPKYYLNWPEVPKPVQEHFHSSSDAFDTKTEILLFQKQAKTSLVNAVCLSLIRGPSLKNAEDVFRQELLTLCETVKKFDPEFILKVALYARQELNIRSTANLLLAFVSFDISCRPYLKRYFNKCVVLPSDWIDVADQYQFFEDKCIKSGSLPAALRKCLAAKFQSFDVYRLAKYNKVKSNKKSKKKPIKVMIDIDENEENEEEIERRTFTLKKLVRLLHLKDPAEYVMGLIGKRYPENEEKFRKSRLNGVWDESKAGQRMKLPIPVTWETQLSLKGNNKQTWEELIDGRKLPYMAMLRNLRNIILAGISSKYHTAVLDFITNKEAVIKSRQFPHQFAAAQEVLKELETDMYDAAPPSMKRKSRNTIENAVEKKKMVLRAKARAMKSRIPRDLFRRYEKALTKAIGITTFFNVSPIPGKTVILLDIDLAMAQACSSAKGLGKSRTVMEMARLLTKLCTKSSEMSVVYEFHYTGEKAYCMSENPYSSPLLLSNIDETLFTPVIRNKEMIDNFIVFTSTSQHEIINHFISKYRLCVNSNLLYVTVCLSMDPHQQTIENLDDKDVCLYGFTDGVLRFIAERGKQGQLGFIERIDEKYNLGPLPRSLLANDLDVLLTIPHNVKNAMHPSWQVVKVFISSTFLDMHGERDLLIKYIFPELRNRARQLGIDVREVDLRWGITEEQSNNDKSLLVCLKEVCKCHLFIGILGGRYGFVPKSVEISEENSDLEWVKQYPTGASITELEFHAAALANPDEAKDTAFFFIRDSSAYHDVPKHILKDFIAENEDSKTKLQQLKARVCNSGLEVFNKYPCKWGGIISGKPLMVGLEEFGQRVLNNLWVALIKIYNQKNKGKHPSADSEVDESMLHAAFAAKHNANFIGRKTLVDSCMQTVLNTQQGLVLIVGKPGSGKTALMAHILYKLNELIGNQYPVIYFFVGATIFSGCSLLIQHYLINQIKKWIKWSCDLPLNQSDPGEHLKTLLIEGVRHLKRIFILIDGLDTVEKHQKTKILEELNLKWPKGITIVCTTIQNGHIYRSLHLNEPMKIISVGFLSLPDRMQVIRNFLSKHSKFLDETTFNNQLQMLALKQDSNQPLFIALACEELKTFGIFEKLTGKIKTLSSTTDGLLQEILERLEEEFGSELISGALGLLSVCDEGLHEDDLYALLSVYTAYHNRISNLQDVLRISTSPSEVLPCAIYSNLLMSLQCLLQQTNQVCDGVLKFSYVNIITAVRSRYQKSILSELGERLLHCIIAGYFWKLADPLNNGSWRSSAPHALLALPHHLLAANCFNELEEVLCNLNYISSKVEAGLIDHLLDDYYLVDVVFNLSKIRTGRLATSLSKIQEFKSFVVRNLHSLKLVPKLIIQQAINEPEGSIVSCNAKMAYEQTRHNLPPLVKRTNKLAGDEGSQLTLRHSKPVLCVALSPDEMHVAAGEGNAVHLYNLNMVKKLTTFTGHDGEITCLLFIGCNKLCSASDDGAISLWSVDEKCRMYALNKHRRRVSSCCCDSAGHTLVSVSWDGSIILWKVNSGEQESVINPVDKWSPINCVAFHPLKQLIVTGGWDCSLKLWCLLKLKCIAIFRGHTASVSSVSISPDGELILSTSLDATFKLWSSEKGIQLSSIINAFPFTSACFTASGSHIFVGSIDKMIKIYSTSFGKKMSVVKAMKNVAVTSIMINSECVICGYEDGSIQAMDFLNYSVKAALLCGNSAVTCLSSWRNKPYLVVGMKDGALKTITDKFEMEKSLFGHKSAITSVACSHDLIVSGSENGYIAVYNKKAFINNQDVVADHICFVHNGSVTSISFKWTSKIFATTGDDRMVKIWAASTFLLKHSEDFCVPVDPELVLPSWHMSSITACCWVKTDEKSELLITAGKDLLVCGWDIFKSERIWEEKKLNAPVIYLTSLKEKIIIGGSLDGALHIWSFNGVRIISIPGNSQIYFATYFVSKETSDMWSEIVEEHEQQKKKHTPSTAKLQSLANQLKNITVARTTPGGEVEVFKPCLDAMKEVLIGHSQAVISLATGVGIKLVSSSIDGTVKIWTPKSICGNQEIDLHHCAEVVCLAYDTTNNCILSGDRNGYIILWRKYFEKWQSVNYTKAHKKAITALLIFNKLESHAVSTSNDCSVKFWKYILPVKHHQTSDLSFLKEGSSTEEYLLENNLVSLLATYNLAFPVTSCVYNSQINALIVGMTQQSVCTLNVIFNKEVDQWRLDQGLQFICKENVPDASEIKNWVMHLKLINLGLSESLLFTVNCLGCIGRWKIMPLSYSKENYAEIVSLKKLRDMKINEENCHKQTWPCTFSVIQEFVESKNAITFKHFIGLGSGELLTYTLFEQCDKFEVSDVQFKQVHNGAVNGLACLRSESDGHYIIATGGDDEIVRVWEFVSNSYKQVGHFNCKSQVKCLIIAQDVMDIRKIHITCGDALGNMYFLNVEL